MFWRCTAVHALTLGLPGRLEDVAKVLGLEQQKDTTGKALIRYFCTPCKPTKTNGMRTRNLPEHNSEKWEQFKEYCRQDVVVERGIRKRLEKYPVPENEHKLWCLDQKINDTGIKIDRKLVENAIECDLQFQARKTEEAIQLTGLSNPNSVAQLKTWIFEQEGVEVESLDKETVSELIKTTKNETVKKMLVLRQTMAKTSVKKYDAMIRAVREDGKVRGLFQFCGANRTWRWAGRIVQFQNLPKNSMRDLDMVRNLLLSGDYEMLEILFDSVPGVLSQVIRTAFIPSDGCIFLVSDFSAIEARVIAWLANEVWRMEVFRTHGKIYEASASQMFKVPLESITKANPLRQKGKISELALGYAGGVGALVTMGALKQGLTEEELPELVSTWRAANPAIVRLWKDVEKAAISAVKDKKVVQLQYGVKFSFESGILFIKLPSGRRLAYCKAAIENDTRFNRPKLTYWGMDQVKKVWSKVDTYGGKLVENCLAGDTLVLTINGWIGIKGVHKDDLLWDGIEWVNHSGVVCNGIQQTIKLDDIGVTPGHRVLTEGGWVVASSCEGLNRSEVSLPDSNILCRFGRKEIIMECPLRLWKRIYHACYRVREDETEVMWLQAWGTDSRVTQNSQHVKSSGVLGMEINGGQMQTTNASSLAQLRSKRDQSLLSMGNKFRSFLGGYGPDVQRRVNSGQEGQQRRLFTGELPLDNTEETMSEQKGKRVCKYSLGLCDVSRGGRTVRDRNDNSALPSKKRVSGKPFVLSAGREEQVYDIINAGPRNRFTVLGSNGPFIVHNCIQAIARDCLAEALIRVDAAGYRIAAHVHDEIVCDVPLGWGSLEELNDIMGQPIKWAPGLPVPADGFSGFYYKKDD